MEKTLRILKQESYLEGYSYACEQIALDLERQATYAMISNEYSPNDTAVRAKTYHHAAQIARGEKNDNTEITQGQRSNI